MKENKPAQEERRFRSNSKIFTICVYVVVTFAICAIIALIVFNFSSAWSGVKTIFRVLTPFLLGIILAYLVNPLYKFFDFTFFAKWLHMRSARRTRKVLAIVLSYVVVFGIIVLVIVFVIPQLGQSLETLINNITNFMPTVQNWLSELQTRFAEADVADLSETIDSLVSRIISYLQDSLGSMMSSILSTSISVISGVVSFLMAIFVSIYVIADKQRLERSLRNIIYAVFRHDTAVRICRRARESSTIFSNFFAGKVIDSLVIGLLTFIMMTILGLPYAVLISSVVAVTNMIPDFGPIIGAIPGILILLMVGFREGLTFGILILVIQQLDGRFIGPHILGDSTGLRPIWILFAITIGARIGGVIGMFVAVPIMAIIVYLIEDSVNERLKKKGLDSLVTERKTPTSWNVSSLFRKSDKKRKKDGSRKNTENINEEDAAGSPNKEKDSDG